MTAIASPRKPKIHNHAKRRRWASKIAKIQSGLRSKVKPRYAWNRANRRAAMQAKIRKERCQARIDDRNHPLFAAHCQRCNLRFFGPAAQRCQCKAAVKEKH